MLESKETTPRDNVNEDFTLNTLVWGVSNDGWCPAIIVQDSLTKQYTRQGDLNGFELHLRFLTETAYSTWQSKDNIYLFQLGKSPIGIDMRLLGEGAKSALLKANDLYHLPLNERMRMDSLEGLETNLSQSEVVSKYISVISNYTRFFIYRVLLSNINTFIVSIFIEHFGN